MRLRPAKREDIKEMVNVYLESYRGLEEYAYNHPDDVQAYLDWLFRRDAEGIWLAQDCGQVVGFVAGDRRWFSKREGKVVGALHELVVLPAHRRKGIGRSLVERAFEHFRDRALDTVELWVGDENRPAMSFYKRLGFQERDRFNYWLRMTRPLK